MALAQNKTSVRAGLVFQALGLNEHLRVALAEAGVNVVAESLANQLVSSQIEHAQIDVFVVNLDPELEDHLDELTELLDRSNRPVIFNDGAASAGLAGWDQARWARHLAAKIKGELDSTPPRPVGAQAVPTVLKPAPKASIAPPLPAAPIANKPAELIPVAAPLIAAAQLSEAVAPALVKDQPVADPFAELAEINLDFDQAPSQTFARAEDTSGMDDFDASMFDMPQAVEQPANDLDDLDALFKQQPAKAEADSGARASANTMELPILKVDSSAVPPDRRESSSALPPDSPSQLEPATADLGSALDWSLEPLDGELPPAPPPAMTGRAVFGAKDIAPAVAPSVVPAPMQQTMPAVEVQTDLGDLDFFADLEIAASAAPAEAPASAGAVTTQQAVVSDNTADFGDLNAMFEDFSIPDGPAVSAPVAQVGSADLDFDLDFEVGAPAFPTSAQTTSSPAPEDDFSDLDALFADPPTPASLTPVRATAANSTGPQRVMVLGASIGGPEAVRSFLGKLKANTPVAFVLAQHMGAEFLELMTNQLAKASNIPVRLAKPGDVFQAGEVYVVPVNQRFEVTSESVVQFSALPNESPYSPSIDQVLIDMADRFGARCNTIIFSGMASDAIEGAKYLASRGGKIWVQDPSTCVISSMIDGAQAAGVVSFVGAPEQLADHLQSTIA
jgi:chemosensory pili system protein ChpB (putative protein-glutamate methylesterase)